MWMLAMVLLGPFLIAHYFGIKGATKWMVIFLVFNVLVFLGFITGILFAFAFEPRSYWDSFSAQHFTYVTTTMVDSWNSDTPLVYSFMIPWYALIDFYRVVWTFNVHCFCIPLVVPELVSLFILRNIYVIMGHGRGPVGVSQREIDFYKGGF